MADKNWGWFGNRSSGEGIEFETPAAATNWGWFGNRASGEGLEFAAPATAWSDHAWLRGGQYIMAAQAGGTPLDINALLGTANASGFTASVDRQLGVAATVGTATASGLTANVDRQSAITGILGTASANGYAANVDKQYAITCTLGTATASGFTAGIDQQASITAILGAATASGLAAQIDVQYQVTATTGTVTADGFTGNIDQQHGLAATVGGAVADGYLATIDFQASGMNITAAVGIATASGFTANAAIASQQGVVGGGFLLLSLTPLIFPRNNAHSGGTYVDPDITHRAIRGKEQAQRTPAMLVAEAHLQRLQEIEDGAGIAGITSGEVDLGGVSGGDQPLGNASVRIPRHERTLAGRLPAALGAGIAASDAIPFELNEAMRQYAAKQAADEDDEMAMIIILAGVQ